MEMKLDYSISEAETLNSQLVAGAHVHFVLKWLCIRGKGIPQGDSRNARN